MFVRFTCTGGGADLSGDDLGSSRTTTCPKCGVQLDPTSVAQARSLLSFLGVIVVLLLLLVTGGAAGLIGQHGFFADADTIVPGVVIAAGWVVLSLVVLAVVALVGERARPVVGCLFLVVLTVGLLGSGIWALVRAMGPLN